MNELSNHDHSRFLTRTNGKVGRVADLGSEAASQNVRPEIMREAVVMQMTWPGAPTIYYGDEAGVCGFTDPDNRRTYPWGHEDQDMLKFHKRAIALHKAYPVLTHGSLKFLSGGYNVLAYGRFSRKSQIAVIFNNNTHEEEVRVPVWQIGVTNHHVMRFVFGTDSEGFSEVHSIYPVRSGEVTIVMRPTSSVVLVAEDNVCRSGSDEVEELWEKEMKELQEQEFWQEEEINAEELELDEDKIENVHVPLETSNVKEVRLTKTKTAAQGHSRKKKNGKSGTASHERTRFARRSASLRWAKRNQGEEKE
jgi:hypothetical protein